MTLPISNLAVIVDAPGSIPTGRLDSTGRVIRRKKQDQDPNPERVRCEIMRAQMEAEKASFISHWRDLTDFILPRRGRFWITDRNRGDRRTRHIIDSTATQASRILVSGMMSGLTSPARPWYRLTTGVAELDERGAVKKWLEEVRRRQSLAFLRSNLYQALPVVYGDAGVFGTAAVAMEEDDEQIFRFYPFPIGTYAVQANHRGKVDVFMRTFQWQVWQIVERWGNLRNGVPDFNSDDESVRASSRISPVCQNLYRRNFRQQWLDINHFIYPNQAFDSSAIESRYKKFKSVYYEYAAPVNLLLEDKGFDEFPVFTPRWEVAAEDNFGTNSPGMTALGDIRQLQVTEKRISQALEKKVNPPMKGPTALRAAKVSTLPGDITYVDEREGSKGFTAVYDTAMFDVDHAERKQEQTRERINRVFFADIFMLLTQMDKKERQTVPEITQLKEERMLALGPVLEQMNQDLYDPLINRAFNIMQRKGLIPPPPPELRGQPFHAEYISIMAQAQKVVANANLERFVSFLAQVSQALVTDEQNPEVFDNVDVDQLIEEYAEAMGISPTLIKSEDAVQAIRTARKRAQEQAAQAEQAQKLAGAAKDASQADMGGDTALTRLFGKRTARNTLNATDTPPMGPTGIPATGGIT